MDKQLQEKLAEIRERETGAQERKENTGVIVGLY